MATTEEGPDWNPRTLSTFSTFGSGGGGTTPVEFEKVVKSGDEITDAVPLVNGDVHHKDKPSLVNGQISKFQKKSKKSPCPSVDESPASPTSSLQRRHHPSLSSCSSGSSSTSGVSSVTDAVLNRPDLLLPVYNHPQFKDPPDDGTQVKAKATKVAPPIIPKHFYSKSLVGDQDSVAVMHRHGYSRSMGEEELEAGSLKFKDGIGEVSLFLGPANRRFGFSVVGGIDEKFPPRIDEIAKGSPADKADLEVGDEILEVNGKSLEDATHTEVISHIHQCIRSRTICLRVKRRTGNKLAADLAASSNVQDAFVIAVEQRARERLERLSALKKIKPVDMTKLSTQLSEPPPNRSESPTEAESEDVNGVLEASPIYVTSVPNLTSTSAPVKRSSSRTQSRSSTPGRGSSSSPRHRPKSPTATSSSTVAQSSSDVHSSSSSSTGKKRSGGGTPGTTPIPSHPLEGDADAGNKSGDELELTHDLDNDENVCTTGDSRSEDDLDDEVSESGESLPATPEKTYGLGAHHTREARREVLLDTKSHAVERPRSPLEYTTSLESKDSSSSRKSGGSGSSSGGTAPSKPLTSSKRSSGYGDRGGGFGTGSDLGADPQESMISMVEFNPANKEMAVDVPDTFVGRTKTPPRYPPPKPQGGSGYISSVPYNNNNNSNSSKGSSKRGTSLSSGTVTPVNGTLSKPVSPPVVPDSHQRQDVLVHSPNTQEEMNKLKKYEEEYKQRREREEEVAELQRNSIRGSQKLQSLASYPQGSSPQPSPTGVVNQAFDQEDVTNEEDKSSSPSINELIQSLQRIQSVLKLNGHRISEDMTFVAQLLVNPEFQKVLAVHNKVQETWCLNRPPTPVTFKAQELVAECLEVLNDSSSPDALELVQVLSKYQMEGLFYAHDRIADSEPPLEEAGAEQSVDAAPEEPVERVSNYPEENVKIVRIDKTNEPLGATIRNEGSSVIIGRIVQGGAAEKSGRLHEGDEILEVNGVEVRGKSVNDVCDMLAGMTGTLTFIIIPCPNLPVVTPSPPVHAIHVKAFFDYDPEEDLYIPCRELGMSFQKGDILHVMNQQDPNWWQAYRDGEEDQSLAGLIPSKSFQQQREAMRQTVVGDNNNKEKSKKGKLLCAKKHQKKKKKKILYPNYNDDRTGSMLPLSGKNQLPPEYERNDSSPQDRRRGDIVFTIKIPKWCCHRSNSSSTRNFERSGSVCSNDYDAEEILTYEEVALYFPRANRKRPIVLIGPPNIGRHELRQKLMGDTEKFAAAVPHTSRPKKEEEVDGQDYHFISRPQFEADILARKFVEHGEFEKAYYGTSLDAIRAVVNSGKICVLNLHPLSLKMLKNSDLMPYVVLIAPPSLEKLRQKKQRSGETVWEDELKETIQKAREMEDQYGHYFDLVLINQDIERTYQQLIHEINVLEREPQWVPAAWLANER